MKVGDVSRSRRFADPVRQRWYAYHRSVRFASRMRGDREICERVPTSELLRDALLDTDAMMVFCLQHIRN
jgi:hypothetical protein